MRVFKSAQPKLGEALAAAVPPRWRAVKETVQWPFTDVYHTNSALTSEKLNLLKELFTELRNNFIAKLSDADALLKIGESPADPTLDPTELATLTTLAQALLNLDANISLR